MDPKTKVIREAFVHNGSVLVEGIDLPEGQRVKVEVVAEEAPVASAAGGVPFPDRVVAQVPWNRGDAVTRANLLSWLDQLEPSGRTKEEVDAYIREERASWGDR
jgi:hypothetical protein